MLNHRQLSYAQILNYWFHDFAWHFLQPDSFLHSIRFASQMVLIFKLNCSASTNLNSPMLDHKIGWHITFTINNSYSVAGASTSWTTLKHKAYYFFQGVGQFWRLQGKAVFKRWQNHFSTVQDVFFLIFWCRKLDLSLKREEFDGGGSQHWEGAYIYCPAGRRPFLIFDN